MTATDYEFQFFLIQFLFQSEIGFLNKKDIIRELNKKDIFYNYNSFKIKYGVQNEMLKRRNSSKRHNLLIDRKIIV